MLCIKIFTYNVQSRSVLKTYFETGDKPTAAQFGDLIDSALMAQCTEIYDTTFYAIPNTLHDIVMGKTFTCNSTQVTYGESFVVNAFYQSESIGGAVKFTDDDVDLLLYAAGYNDVQVTGGSEGGVMSYAVLKTWVNDAALGSVLINRAFYYIQ